MKKNYFKKSLSLVMAVLMLVSCWVFVAPTDADAIMDNSSKKADKYGTAYWTANDNNTRWMRWGSAADSSNDHLYIKVPKTIYMDVSETLQSAGYVITYSWHFGDSTSYRIGISSPVWGENSSYSGQDSNYFYTMTNAFNGFTADASMHGSNAYGVNGYSNTNQYDIRVFDTYNSYKSIGLKNLKGTLYSGTIYYVGTPKGTYTGRYSTYGSNPSYFGYGQKWSTTKWTEHSSYTNMMKGKPTAASEQHDGWNEVFWDVEIYDKAPLKTAADNAAVVYNDHVQYKAYNLNDGLANLQTLENEARAMLTVREQTNATITAKTDAVNSAAGGLQFQANNAELKTKVAEAKALQNKAGYETLCTAATKNALQEAIDAATNSTLYTSPAIYTRSQQTNAGALAAADQATIATLINNITVAMNSLELRHDIGYDNLFSLTDWALNPVKDSKLSSNGTIAIDADKGTIKITHDGSANGTDNNTSQQPTYYRAQVKGNTEYVLTWETAGAGRAQIHVFYTTGDQYTYNVNSNYSSGSHWFVGNGDLPYSSDMGKHEVAFTTLPETDGLVFRFGTCNSGDSVTFSNIRLVEKSVYDAYAKNYTTVREAFSVGDTKNLSYTPTREGYTFDGWYKADGTKVTDVSGFSASDIVYAHWVQQVTVTFQNESGNTVKTVKVAPGEKVSAPANPSKAATSDCEYKFDGWFDSNGNKWTEETKITGDVTYKAKFSTKAHENVEYVEYAPADCTTAGTFTRYCKDCNFAWDEPIEDETRAPKLGHSYNRGEDSYYTIKKGSSTGDKTTDVHTVVCDDCGAEDTLTHKFEYDATNQNSKDGTCVNKAETYEKCDCGQTRLVYGDIDPENHVNTELRGVVAAKCGVPGYTGDTYCTGCNTKTATGTATEALDHIFTNYVDQNNATCDTEGTKVATCDREGCNATDTQFTGVKREHSFTNYVDQGDATCDKAGNEIATCDYDDCNATDTRSTSKKREHSFTNYVDQGDATCAKEGNEIATCDYADCNATDKRSTGKKREHKFEIAVSNNNGTHKFECSYDDCDECSDAVDCGYGAWTTNNTTHSHTCTTCGYTPAAEAHDWPWVPAEAGKQTRTCTVCRKTETTDCNYVEDSSVDVTCEVDGTVTYKCTDCGHGYTDIVEKAPGHNFSGAYVSDGNGKHVQKCVNFTCTATGNEADCSGWTYNNTAAGTHTATCAYCDYVKTEACSGGKATCTELAVCQYCEKAYGEKAAHVITGTAKYLKKATDATCIANETYYKYCINCENEFSTETYEKPDTMTAHDYTCTDEYLYIATQAKCGVNETYYAYCSNADCKKSSEDADNTYEKADTALTHKFDSNIVCNNNGTHTYECSQSNTDGWACDVTADYNCADAATLVGVVNAECLTAGYNMYQCRLCDYEWTVETEAALGHEYTVIDKTNVKEEANCDHGTIYWYACKWCDAKGSDEQDTEKYTTLFVEDTASKRAHDWKNKTADEYMAKEATCNAAAWYYASCSYADCAKSAGVVEGENTSRKFQSGTSRGHDWVKPDQNAENFVDYRATKSDCITPETYYYVCSRADECNVVSSKGSGKEDGETWVLEGSESGHNLAYTAANDATCYAEGNYEYWYCSVCKKYFKDSEANEAYANQNATEISKRDHNIVKVAYVGATCEVDGCPAYEYCSYEDCGYTTRPAVIPEGYKATGHIFDGAYTYDSVHGYHSKLCRNGCGKSGLGTEEYTVEYDGLDYIIKNGEKCEFTYKAETENGVHTHALACVCGNNTSKTYSYEETFVETILPTCTTGGYDSYACPDCGETWKMNEVGPNGHTPAADATSNGDGTHSIRCAVENCNYAISTDKCSGGTATCSDKAVCDVCKTAYGETNGQHVLADDGWTIKAPATCTDAEVLAQICSACNKEQTKTGEKALGHKMSGNTYEVPADKAAAAAAVVNPTCSQYGVKVNYCSVCDYFTTYQTMDKGDHEIDLDREPDATEGNCATGVVNVYYCKCGVKVTKPGDAGHEFDIAVKSYGTCNANGYIIFSCVYCGLNHTVNSETAGFGGTVTVEGYGDINTSDLLMKEHDTTGSELIETKAPTCTAKGRGYKVCSLCKTKVYEDIDALTNAHNPESEENTLKLVKGYDATCTSAGRSNYYECKVCGYSENADNSHYIAAEGHKDANNDGSCDKCGSTYNEVSKNCGCICHKESGFMKFIYKVLKFFWKLFGMNKECPCGVIHY